jgi:signal transduction histidine kinase
MVKQKVQYIDDPELRHLQAANKELLAKSQEMERFASFLLLNPDPIIELDVEGRVLFCNMAAEGLLGKDACFASTNPLIPRQLPEILHTLSENESLRLTLTIEESGEADAKIFDELIHLSPQHRSIRIYATDATARVRAEEEVKKLNADLAMRVEELAEANQELETFNYTVSHDLRNPLNAIGINSQYLEIIGSGLDEEYTEGVQRINKAVSQMSDLIDTLMEFSKVAHTKVERKNIDLSEMVRDVAARIYQTMRGRKILFMIAEGVTIYGDEKLLRVLIENLIGNACKYTSNRDKSVIEFGAMEREGEQVFFVRDNGIGFDNAHVGNLFVPFQRLPGAEEFKGHGVGMSTVARIIKRHGGRIWGEGEPSKGATFYFTVGS